MKGSLLTAAALALGLTTTLSADNAKERGSGGGSSSSATDRAPTPSGGSQTSGSSGSSSSYSPSSSSSSSSSTTDAERRHPRPGTGHGYAHGGNGYSHYYPGYYYPYYYGGYSYYGYPYYYGYWWYDPYYSAPYVYHGGAHDDYGSLRVLVEPTKAKVYVDGYYAGVVDDFDGLFQRLTVAPGKHEITFKLDGYRTHRVRLYVPADRTIKLSFDMHKGDGEDPVEERVSPEDRDDDMVARRDDDGEDDKDKDEARAKKSGKPLGTLRLSVSPEDASVYVDGHFRGSSTQMEDLPLLPGRHRVEVVRPGYRTFNEEVEVAPGQPTNVEVALEKLEKL